LSDTLDPPPKNKGGRPKGATNKVTREIRAIAGEYGPDAVRRLAVLGGLKPKGGLRKGEAPAKSEATQVVALGAILNRAYGFPSQPLQHSADESFETLLDRLERRRLGQPEPVVIELEVARDGSFEAIEPETSADDPDQPITDWIVTDDEP
jgi:hypothetical protein